MQAKAYAFAVPVSSDLQEAEQLLGDGRLADALARVTDDRLLPASGAPRVIEARERLEEGLREAVLRSGDPDLLAAWCRTAAGEDDEAAARAILALLEPGDARLAGARAQLARLHRSLVP